MTAMFPDRPAGLMLARELVPEAGTRRTYAASECPDTESVWSFNSLSGSLVELYGSSSLTALMPVLRDAQKQGEDVCWIQTDTTIFFPPDAHAHGVDAGMIYVVCAVAGNEPENPYAIAAGKAADTLLRLRAFRCVVIDLGPRTLRMAVLSRLLRCARLYNVAVICRTDGKGLLGSLVSVRVEANFEGPPDEDLGAGVLAYRLRAVKDRRTSVLWERIQRCGSAVCLR